MINEKIQKIGIELKNTSEKIRDNKEVVLEAVKHNGMDLNYASDRLKNDPVVVLEAIRENPNSLIFASNEIQELCKNRNPFIKLELMVLLLDA